MKHLTSLIFSLWFATTANAEDVPQPVTKATSPITIDGQATESDWRSAKWYPLDKYIIGGKPAKKDFSGRYKLLWDTEFVANGSKIEAYSPLHLGIMKCSVEFNKQDTVVFSIVE